jgi:hypothetical protein
MKSEYHQFQKDRLEVSKMLKLTKIPVLLILVILIMIILPGCVNKAGLAMNVGDISATTTKIDIQTLTDQSKIAAEKLKSFRNTSINYEDKRPYSSFDTIGEYILSDRHHFLMIRGGNASEFILIGNEFYRLATNNTAISIATSEVSIPTFLLFEKRLTDLQQLPDETVDGVKCFHFSGTIDIELNITVSLWISVDDYYLRQILTTYVNRGKVTRTRFYDFDAQFIIDAPLAESGELLPEWRGG